MVSDGISQMNRRKKAPKKLVVLLTVVVMVLALAGCNTLEDGVEKAKPLIPKGYTLMHIHQVSDNSGIVFYTFENEISAGIFIKTKLGWEWIGSCVGKLITYPEGLQWRYADLGDKSKNQYSVYYGKVDNADICEITVTTQNGNIANGTIVETENTRLWFAFVDEPQVPSVNVEIAGLNAEGKAVYSYSPAQQ